MKDHGLMVPLCWRTAHSGFIRSGPRRMECRVPVAFQIATGDDARSEGQPSHPSLILVCGTREQGD